MSHELPLRITVIQPPRGVAWAVQSGRSELIEPSERTEALIVFDLTVRLGTPRRALGYYRIVFPAVEFRARDTVHLVVEVVRQPVRATECMVMQECQPRP